MTAGLSATLHQEGGLVSRPRSLAPGEGQVWDSAGWSGGPFWAMKGRSSFLGLQTQA